MYPSWSLLSRLCAAAAIALGAAAVLSTDARPALAAHPAAALDATFADKRPVPVTAPGTFATWRSVLARHAVQIGGPPAAGALDAARVRWTRMIEAMRPLAPLAQVVTVDRVFNAIPYAADRDSRGADDHWATPLEFLAAGKGDCEDYAVAKYLALKALGFADRNLRLVAAIDRAKGSRLHVFLLVDVGGAVLALDNRRPTPRLAMDLVALTPVYGLNGNGAWMYLTAH